MGLGFYRLVTRGALPVLLAHGLWQRLCGRASRGALSDRMARGTGMRPTGKVLWLHGASNGELTSVRWLVARLIAETPELSLIITCNTETARGMVRGWGLPRVCAQLAPFDLPGPVARFLARWRPDALLIVENELWPERLAQASAMAPVLLIGARMSQRSARGWARFAPGLMRGMLESLSLVSAQDTASEARLLALGLPGARMLPALMLKSRAAMAQVAAGGGVPALATTGFPPRARCLLAASTHAGEDAPILDAFAQARAAGVFDLLILAPRHPRRAPDIAALIAARGLAFATRSAGEPPGPQTVVYLADTLGEMRQWYARAGATVIGGTLQDHGGHTPFEPAAHGSAIVHGPHVANFAESFAALDTAGAALAVGCGTSLGPALITLGPDQQSRLATAAQAVLLPEGDEAALIVAIHGAMGMTTGR